MPTEPLTRDLIHTIDAIELPPLGSAVEGRSARRDSYPIVVTRSPEDTVERLLQLVGDAKVALITDANVAELHAEASFITGTVVTIDGGELSG